MEILDIRVEYASGFTIIDRAILIPELFEVSTSERVASVMREFALTEAPPRVSVTIRGQSVELEQGVGGHFVVPEGAFESGSGCRWWLRVLRGFVPQTRDQRQQFGRLMHTLSAASLIGAIGFWHSTSVWTFANILSEANLVLAFVITYYEGMVSMKGE